ncbi:MAG: ribonuclease R [Firmicutes bacterium]|nr:ribonuclease R [Bacillota bacterium]
MAKRKAYRPQSDNLSEKIFAVLYNREPVSEDELVARLTKNRHTGKAFFRIYRQYRQEGWIVRAPEGGVTVATRQGSLRVNPRGFGFVVSPDYPGTDVFVPERWLAGARHDDVVTVWVRPSAQGFDGRVMNIVKRATEVVIGTLERHRGSWSLKPRDPRRPVVEVASNPHAKWHPGDIARAKITDWPLDPKRPVRGEVVEVLGAADSPGVDVSAIAAEYQLSPTFPDAVLAEAEKLPQSVTEAEYGNRVDLTDTLIVTIDGSDAKDLDDAISLEPLGDGYRIGVHIADVSHYVAEGSAMDMEARRRGTSVYLVDRVIPMLPQRLSNGIASLNPGVLRLTVSVEIDLSSSGEVLKTKFFRSVIRSRHRLTYQGVNEILEGGLDVLGLRPWLEQLDVVRDLLRSKRVERGAVDFELPEAKVVLDDHGHPVDVVVRSRGVAESIIEELMLLANEAVAHELLRTELPGLFRVHDEPSLDKMTQFREMIGVLGYRLPEQVTPKSLQSLINRVKGLPEERVINSALLRSMKQARYGPKNTGHFGLAAEEYTHFTSPIRRYPDLWVHRVLTRYLENRVTEADRERWQQLVASVGEDASAREREAMEAERDSVALKEAEFMANKIGQEYEAVISGVTNFGIFVELPNLIEGLVRLEDLPQDYWVFDPVHYRLRGQRTGREYGLGSPVTVVVMRVDTGLRRIDFGLQEDAARRKRRVK